MQKNSFKEFGVALLLIVAFLLLVNPFDFWMPDAVGMALVVAILILLFIFVGFVWKEKPNDEREEQHSFVADRFAYLSGLCVAVVAIVWQSVRHELDIWLVAVAGVMLIAKIIARWYQERDR